MPPSSLFRSSQGTLELQQDLSSLLQIQVAVIQGMSLTSSWFGVSLALLALGLTLRENAALSLDERYSGIIPIHMRIHCAFNCEVR